MSQLMRLCYLSHRRLANAQAGLRIRAVSPEPSLFAHMKYGSRRRIQPKIRHLAPLDGCAYVFEEWIYGGRKVPKSHEMAQLCSLWRRGSVMPLTKQQATVMIIPKSNCLFRVTCQKNIGTIGTCTIFFIFYLIFKYWKTAELNFLYLLEMLRKKKKSL